jgi:hypothetical protein
MKNYYLFLDEVKPSTQFNHFCLAGCIVEDNVYNNQIIPYICSLKDKVFGSRDVILHEIEIRRAEKQPYMIMNNGAKRAEFWSSMDTLFSIPGLFITIGVAINCTEYYRLYNSNHKCDEYFIGLQIIMENFTNFLEKNNGIGSIMVEARTPKENERLQNHFYTLKATGTLFLDMNAIQKRLSTISFPLKTDNNIGVQLADFIPNPLVRKTGGLRQKNPTLYNHIEHKLYDGGLGLPNRFGLKVIP